MTRHLRLWIIAALSLAAVAIMVGLAVAAHTGVSHLHLAGISLNAID
jgi:hypothetical protein